MAVTDTPALVIVVIGGLATFLSYALAFKDNTTGYLAANNPYWLGYTQTTITWLVALQLAAALGFLMFAITWLFLDKPKTGVLARPGAMAAAFAVFFVGAVAWAPCQRRVTLKGGGAGWKAAASLALVASAVGSLLFVAGAAEDTDGPWYALVGTILLAATVVLGDGVAYNARMLTR